MKKLLTILLCVAILLSCGACGKTADPASEAEADTNPSSAEEAKPADVAEPDAPSEEERLTLTALQQAETRDDIAALIGLEAPSGLEQMLAYLKNFYFCLPNEGDATEPVTEWDTTEDGYNFLTMSQARTLVTPTVITTENWTEFLEPHTESVHVNYVDDDGNEIDEYEDESDIVFKDGYYCALSDLCLRLTNNVTGIDMEYDGWFWPERVSLEDGIYYTYSYDENGDEHRAEFSFDNYTCTLADGVAYAYELPNELCYIDPTESYEGESVYTNATDADRDDDSKNIFVMVRFGNGQYDICYVGYNGFGKYVFTDEDTVSYSEIEAKPVVIAPAASLTLAMLQQLQTREELAAVLGVADASMLRQMLTYLKNYYYHTPAADEAPVSLTEWGTTEDGCNCMTPAQARALITPIVITTENWKEYVIPHMQSYKHYDYDDDGNETVETRQRPDISVSEEYQCAWESKLVLRNDKTGRIVETDGRDWPESVSVSNGKYCVTPVNENGFGVSEEYDPDDYTCLFADGVIYSYTVPEELLYIHYYDDTTGDSVFVLQKDYDGNDDYPYVFVKYEGSEIGMHQYGYNTLGNVFTD